jgi:hypothetical protein
MALKIISAEERLAESRGIKAAIFGGSGQGKTSLLWTLPADRTIFMDLEAGDLAVEGWTGDTIRPRTWQECRDFAAFIGGPNPALRDDQPYSPAHYASACEQFGDPAKLDRYETVFVDSISVAGRLCFQWCRGQPEAFNAADVPTVMVTGDMGEAERRAVLAAYASGEARVIVNVAVLTEGWDHPPTSCVVLLRPSSYKATMIQMVGRGLRTVDPVEHPGIIKRDCIVLDFGTSSQIHGCLEQDVDLDSQPGTGEAPTKTCPSCEAEIPIAVMECPICGHAFEAGGRAAAPMSDFIMTEIDLLSRSSFQWCDLFGDDASLMANGFHGWAGIFFLNGAWHAVGGARGEQTRLLSIGERLIALAAADDWLNEHETDESAHKSRRWLREPPTERQLAYLQPERRSDYSLTRYHASALLGAFAAMWMA